MCITERNCKVDMKGRVKDFEGLEKVRVVVVVEDSFGEVYNLKWEQILANLEIC